MCSLREGVIRPAVVCEINVLACGTILDDFKFSVGHIKSHARLNYDDVSDHLDGVDTDFKPSTVVQEQLRSLESLAKARMDWRSKNASTFNDTLDYRFEIDEDSNVVGLHLDERRIGNRLIEEAMILSNECCGRALLKHFGFGVFNVHDGFSEKYFDDVANVLSEFSSPVSMEDAKSLEAFSKLRRWVNEQPDQYLDCRLRKFQAFSDVRNVASPHFAMGLGVYATWTSPIRKYGDMTNHRLLKAMILGKTEAPKPSDEICETIVREKIKHKRASRTISDWLYAKMLKDSVDDNKVYEAEVFDISRGGVRVRLMELGAAAFVPSRLITPSSDDLVCDSKSGKVSILGDVKLKLGCTCRVILTEVDVKNRRVTAKLNLG
jgi:exoribonuclease-2